jgi:hypothetical protein
MVFGASREGGPGSDRPGVTSPTSGRIRSVVSASLGRTRCLYALPAGLSLPASMLS